MDAIEFMKEKKRMCKSYSECTEACPLRKPMDENRLTCLGYCFAHPEEAVSIVEKWSTENPIKTRQSEFLKLHPNAKISSSGVLAVCPLHIDTGAVDICNLINLNDGCEKCRKEYWLAEVE